MATAGRRRAGARPGAPAAAGPGRRRSITHSMSCGPSNASATRSARPGQPGQHVGRRDRSRCRPDRTSRTRPAWSSSATHSASTDVGSATTTSGRAGQPARRPSAANSTPRHGPGTWGCTSTGTCSVGAVPSVADGDRRQQDRRASSTTMAASMAPTSAGRAPVAAGRRRAHDERPGAVVGDDAPDLGGGAPCRRDDQSVVSTTPRRDRQPGGAGGGEVGGLATDPRRVERGWVVQRDDGGGGVHAP